MFTRRVVPLAIAVGLLSACGAIIHGTRQDISVESSPAGAHVDVNPSSGPITTPATLNLERKHSYVLTFTSPGYEPATFDVTNHLGGGFVAADILLTGLIGVVIDGLTGAWYNLKPETATVALRKAGDGPGPDAIHIHLSEGRNGVLGVESDVRGVVVDVRQK
jgi:hypothetical protein